MSTHKKQTILTIAVLLIVAGGLFAIYQYQKPNEQVTIPSNGVFTPPPPLVQICDLPFHYSVTENSPAILQKIPWLTYENKEYHYRFEYPYVLLLNTDSLPPNVSFDNPPMSVSVSASNADPLFHQDSLDAFLKDSTPTGMRLEKRIKIYGYDAIVTSNLPDREDNRDVLITFFIKDKIFFGIRTQCVDHERVWNSFKFE